MKNLKTLFYTLAILIVSVTANAQFVSVEIGVDGLTCSACTRSVEMSIRKLDFVKDVQMNLENTNGVITFKDSTNVDIEKIAKAVINAGFSVRYLNATYKPTGTLNVTDNSCFAYKGTSYQFVKVTAAEAKSDLVLKFVGKEFLPAKEYKKWKESLKPQCAGAKSTYFVTL
ncbi:MAG TPA: heavy metal-associated domain-containing protein [Bacteroidia bacterium]|nr:heavy metal-associated domain-containing protein [Bacteroidia bacterium]